MSRVATVAAIALFAAAVAASTVAQVPSPTQSADQLGFALDANYPNPFNPETTIPFTLGDALFGDETQVTVTLSVLNTLGQLVVHPVAVDHPAGPVALRSLQYAGPGEYTASWNGADANGAQVAAGVYIVELRVDDERVLRRMARTNDVGVQGDPR